VVAPVTARVLESVVAPVTARVVATVVAPEAVSVPVTVTALPILVAKTDALIANERPATNANMNEYFILRNLLISSMRLIYC
jgi:hypothetical protein